MIARDDLYSCNIFLNSVLPLVKVIIEDDEKLSQSFRGRNAKIQISALNESEKLGTHYIVEDGIFNVFKGTIEKPDLELEFKNVPDLNNFFKGTSKKLPRIRGIKNLGLFIGTLKALLKMAKLLGAKDVPEDKKTSELLVKMYFYLLSSGISQLNKSGHPDVSKWAKMSPDRVYAWAVTGNPELSAFIRVKAGNTKASRGEYRRAKPFFTMRFDSAASALGILMEKDNLIEATVKGRLIMEGAPEFGAQIGDFMSIVGSYAK